MNPNPAPATGLLVPSGVPGEGRAGTDNTLRVRHPVGFLAALRAFRRAIDPDGSVAAAPARPPLDPAWAYRAARRDQARALLALDPAAGRLRLPLDPLLTVADDAWTLEGWNAARSTHARLVVDRTGWGDSTDLGAGTTRVGLAGGLEGLRGVPGLALRVDPQPRSPDDPPPGWGLGHSALMGALTLPLRRVPIDRGGLLGLLGASGTGRAGRSIAVRWESGRPAWAEVGGRPIPLHARDGADGPAGSARVPFGPALHELGDLLPRVEGAELLVDPTGVVGAWAVRLAGGIRLVVALAGWTLDGRLGALRVDASTPPVEAGRFLLNRVVASFRDRPVQSRREVVERTRGNAPAVLAALHRLAALGLILPEPEADRLRWRPAFGPDAVAPDDPEPAEVAAARAITRTASIGVDRDGPLPDGRGRRVEGLILDRPARVELDADGRIRRGACTCSHHEAHRLTRGPCRHLLALQARAVDGAGLASPPADLAAWYAALGGAT